MIESRLLSAFAGGQAKATSILYPRVLGGDQQQANRDPWQARATTRTNTGTAGPEIPFPKYSRGKQPVPETGRGRGLSSPQVASSALANFCVSEQVEPLRPAFSGLGSPPDLE